MRLNTVDQIASDALVIGAGVLGLAVAARLARKRSVILLERHPAVGSETSARNSEVIHAGIHYPADSNKTRWCLRGRELLYSFCEKHAVPHARIGKLVVAAEEMECVYLEKLKRHCNTLGIACESWTSKTLSEREPVVRAVEGLHLPDTGIVDSHRLMQRLLYDFEASGGVLAGRHEWLRAERSGGIWRNWVRAEQGTLEVRSSVVVNAAGLGAAEICNRVLETTCYEHRLCRGRYFTLHSRYRGFRRLIYPVPSRDGLGIHLTLDLAGGARFGPDVDWCPGFRYENADALYTCDWEALRPKFLSAVRRYLPIERDDHLTPGFIGIRPKLFVNGSAHPDFLVESHEGFWHLLGIESPGLTSALAIAESLGI